jgi:hypothetical protein
MDRHHMHHRNDHTEPALTKYSKWYLPIAGLLALVWIALRVIPKPSRATYPCVRAAFPFASGFLAYLAGIGISTLAFAHGRRSFANRKIIAGAIVCAIGISIPFIFQSYGEPAHANIPTSVHVANQPMGEAKGIFPGRVVWVHDAAATNENCSPKSYLHEWYRPENNNQAVIDKMVSAAIRTLTGKTDDAGAWAAIFAFHNTSRGKGPVTYAKGEKIFIKTNATSGWDGNINSKDLTPTYTPGNTGYYAISETSPQIVLSVLRQLVNVVGVSQTDIYIGDPMKHIYKHCYDLWHAEFPGVHYLDNAGNTALGRELAVKSTTARIYYSDKGTVLKSGGSTGTPVTDDFLYDIFEKTEYLINLPMMKGHVRAGVTMFAKNHFGSQTQADAFHLHNGLLSPDGDKVTRPGYGLYRVQVDLFGHKLLGKKNLFCLMDALWSADYETSCPIKFKMSPFNNDWSSSVFASFDPIAIESVGFDILRTEFTVARGATSYPQMDGVDDYLHQAADSANWPKGLRYDPNNDGSVYPSLGVHEHWKDSSSKAYSRNLGTGNGIELVMANIATGVETSRNTAVSSYELMENFPNPFNPTTTIRYTVPTTSRVRLTVSDASGKQIRELVNAVKTAGAHEVRFNAGMVSSGAYYYTLEAPGYKATKKCVLAK